MAGNLLTVPEVSRMLKVSEKTTRRMTQKGVLPVVRFGRCVRVDEQALMQWIAAGGQKQWNACAEYALS